MGCYLIAPICILFPAITALHIGVRCSRATLHQAWAKFYEVGYFRTYDEAEEERKCALEARETPKFYQLYGGDCINSNALNPTSKRTPTQLIPLQPSSSGTPSPPDANPRSFPGYDVLRAPMASHRQISSSTNDSHVANPMPIDAATRDLFYGNAPLELFCHRQTPRYRGL